MKVVLSVIALLLSACVTSQSLVPLEMVPAGLHAERVLVSGIEKPTR